MRFTIHLPDETTTTVEVDRFERAPGKMARPIVELAGHEVSLAKDGRYMATKIEPKGIAT